MEGKVAIETTLNEWLELTNFRFMYEAANERVFALEKELETAQKKNREVEKLYEGSRMMNLQLEAELKTIRKEMERNGASGIN